MLGLKVWTIHAPESKWAQYDCHVIRKGMICKRIVKVFKMLHPSINDSVIVHEAGTKHSVDHAILIFQCYTNLSQQSTQLHTPVDIDRATNVDVVMHNNALHVDGDTNIH